MAVRFFKRVLCRIFGHGIQRHEFDNSPYPPSFFAYQKGECVSFGDCPRCGVAMGCKSTDLRLKPGQVTYVEPLGDGFYSGIVGIRRDLGGHALILSPGAVPIGVGD